MKTIFWVVGEKSGDLHASKVMEKFNLTIPNVQHVGIGGTLMQQHGLKALFPFEKFSIIGFAEVLTHLSFVLKVESAIKKYLQENRPELVVLVDYPGMNLRIAKIASDLHLRVLYYICPQFWAWNHHRVHKLKDYCDHVACIFPFEKELLDMHAIDSTYVGHPITEEVSFDLDKNQFAKFFELDAGKKWVGFFPGSRDGEVRRILPVYLEAMKKLQSIKPDYQFLISKSNTVSNDLFNHCLKNQQNVHIIDGYNYEMMKYSDFMIVKSGTTTIEAASIGTPLAIVYKVNKLSYHIAKKLIRVKYIGLPNIIFDAPVLPELIQDDFNADKIIDTILDFMNDSEKYNQVSAKLSTINSLLGQQSASDAVAELMIKFVATPPL